MTSVERALFGIGGKVRFGIKKTQLSDVNLNLFTVTTIYRKGLAKPLSNILTLGMRGVVVYVGGFLGPQLL